MSEAEHFAVLYKVINSLINEADPKKAEEELTTQKTPSHFNVNEDDVIEVVCDVGNFLRLRKEGLMNCIHFLDDVKKGLRNSLQRELDRVNSGAGTRAAPARSLLPSSRRKRARNARDTNRPDLRADTNVDRSNTNDIGAAPPPEVEDIDVVRISSALLFACGDGPPVRTDTAESAARIAQLFIQKLLVASVRLAETASPRTPIIVDDAVVLRAVEALFPPAVPAATEASIVMSTVCSSALESWPGTAAFRDASSTTMRGPVLRPLAVPAALAGPCDGADDDDAAGGAAAI